MTPTTLLLVLTSATLHAFWNLWTKQIRTVAAGGPTAWLLTVLVVALYAPVAVVVFVTSGWRPTLDVVPWIVGTSVIHVAYFLVLLRGYRVGDLSVVYPSARGTGPLVAAAGGLLLFGEKTTPLAIAGALLIAIAVLVLTLHSPGGPHGEGRRAGIVYGVMTGALIGAYTLWDSWALKHLAIPTLLYYWAGEALRIVAYTPLALADRRGVANLWRLERKRVFAIAALSPLSYLLMLIALRGGAVSRVAPAREVSILIGTWLGGQVLGEADRRRRIAAAVAFVAGVVALAFG